MSLPQTLNDVAKLEIVSDFARELYAATVAQMVCASRAANGRALSDDETADVMRAAIQVVQQVCRVGKQERPAVITRLVALGFEFAKFEKIDADEELCLMTWDDFVQSCQSNAFIDDDGFGELATATHVSDVSVSPSQAVCSDYNRPQWATHVSWYNK